MAAKTYPKVAVSERALIQRLNRKLAEEGQRIKKTIDGTRARIELGKFFIVDTKYRGCSHKNIDLEAWGRKHSALAEWETLEE